MHVRDLPPPPHTPYTACIGGGRRERPYEIRHDMIMRPFRQLTVLLNPLLLLAQPNIPEYMAAFLGPILDLPENAEEADID